MSQIREAIVIDEIRSTINVITNWMAIPLYLVFWVADLIYIPQYKWEFLALRLTIVPLCLVIRYDSRREQSAKHAQLLCVAFAGLAALPINIMIAMIPDVGTGYYAGLNLVAIGGLSFIPFTMNYFLAATFAIYFPYYLIVFVRANNLQDLFDILLNSFFIVGSIIICFAIHIYHEKLRLKEINNLMTSQPAVAPIEK
jgi:hypothetical protein